MTLHHVHLVVPGPLDQRTGGYLYDARMVEEARRHGTNVTVHEVPGRFPELDVEAREALARVLAGIEDGRTVVLDGLAMGCAGELLNLHVHRLRMVALVHHPLADEVGLSPEARTRLRRSETEALSRVRGVVVTSPFTAERIQAFGVPRDAVRAVLPGTTPVPQAAGSTETDAVRLLCVGTLIPRKGQFDLVRALAHLRDRPWSCVCAGSVVRDPAYAEGVRDEITRAGIGDRILLAGELDGEALEEEWRQASIFVLPSHYEGYGMALTEALARGLPVVSTTGGAIPWTVPDEAGVLVPPGDVGALRDSLARLLDDAALRDELSRAARRFAATLPDWPDQAHDFASAVEELASR